MAIGDALAYFFKQGFDQASKRFDAQLQTLMIVARNGKIRVDHLEEELKKKIAEIEKLKGESNDTEKGV